MVHHFKECFIVWFHTFDTKPCLAKASNVGVHRLRVRDACNPREQSAQFVGQYGAAGQITQADDAASPKHPGELIRGGRFVWKRAESAFADHSVKRGVRE